MINLIHFLYEENLTISSNKGWESFSKHLSFIVGDGTSILFWHDRWIGNNTLKFLYPELYNFSDDKEACISDVLCLQEGGIVRVRDLRFYRDFQYWNLDAACSRLDLYNLVFPEV